MRRVRKPDVLAGLDLGRHGVIEASAGTGKTYTIEHLVVELLLSTDARLPEILVVTFTEKATAELVARVRATLLRLHQTAELDGNFVNDEYVDDDNETGSFWLLDDEARRRLRQALDDLDRAQISTIHGFCNRVLAESAFGARRLLDEKPADSLAIGREAFDAMVRTELAVEAADRRWLEAWLSRKSLDDLFVLLVRARGMRAPAPVVDERALTAALDELAPLGDVVMRERQREEGTKQMHKGLDCVARAVEAYGLGRNLPAAVAALDSADTDALWGKFAERIDAPALRRALESVSQVFYGLETAMASRLMARFGDRLVALERERGLYDFDDMLSWTLEALTGPNGDRLVEALRSRYRFALVDEFQDTDQVQWRIFERIFFEMPAGAAVRPLFLVGDPKQSIYGFRGADVQTYLDAKRAVVDGGGTLLTLDANFRSTPALLEMVHVLLDQTAERPLFPPAGGVTYDRPVRAGRPELRLTDEKGHEVTPLVLLSLHEPKVVAGEVGNGGSDGDKAKRKAPRTRAVRDIRAMLGKAIAAEIARLCAEPLVVGGKAIGADEIFVLTKSRADSDEVAVHLAAAGVPFVFYKQDGLLQGTEVWEVLQLLRVIERPDDRGRRTALAATAFVGGGLVGLRPDADPPSLPAAALAEWAGMAEDGAWARLFSSLLAATGLGVRAGFADEPRRLGRYRQVFDLLLDEAAGSRITLAELCQRLSAWHSGEARPAGLHADVVAADLDDTRPAVQIMTIHKSKGLEAAIVFLYGGFGSHTPDVRIYHQHGRRLAQFGRPRSESVRLAVSDEEAAENARLWYVALTRARARLYLPWLPLRSAAPYRTVNEQIERARARPRNLFGEHLDLEVRVCDGVMPKVVSARGPLATWRPAETLLAVAQPVVPRAPAGFQLTSYTQLKEGEAYDPRRELAVRPTVLGPETLPAGAQSGIFLHELLERLPLGPLQQAEAAAVYFARPEVRAVVDRALRRHAVAAVYRADAERMVYAAFTTPIGRPRLGGGLASAERSVREMEFLFPRPGGADLVRGFVDYLFEVGGRVYFADWKSDVLADYRAAALTATVAEHYHLQIRIYSLALVRLLGVEDESAFERRFGGLCYVFVRGLPDGGIHSERPSWRDILRWHEELRP